MYLKDLRKFNDLTQEEICLLCSMSPGRYSTIELGQGVPGIQQFKTMAKSFKMSQLFLGKLRTLALNQTNHKLTTLFKGFGAGEYVRLVRRSSKYNMDKIADILDLTWWDIYDIEYSKRAFKKKELDKFIKTLKLPRNQATILRRNNEHMTAVLSRKKK